MRSERIQMRNRNENSTPNYTPYKKTQRKQQKQQKQQKENINVEEIIENGMKLSEYIFNKYYDIETQTKLSEYPLNISLNFPYNYRIIMDNLEELTAYETTAFLQINFNLYDITTKMPL